MSEKWSDRLRQRLRELKDEIGLTQERLAVELDVTQGSIANWINGRREPNIEQFEALAKALDVDPRWLVFGPYHDHEAEHLWKCIQTAPKIKRDAIFSLLDYGPASE